MVVSPAQHAALERASDAIFDLTPAQGVTYALLVVKDGRLVHERYAAGANAFYLQYSWSMAKNHAGPRRYPGS
jgi:hypothetical protein